MSFSIKISRRILCLFLSIILVFLCSFTALAEDLQETTGKTIKIACIDYDGFFEKSQDGQVTGYGVELLNEISKYTGWKYEYVFDSFSNHLENIKNGKVNFFCHAQKTDERSSDFIFSKYQTGSESSVLYARKDDERFYYNDYKALNGITIGFMKGSYQNDVFLNYASENGFNYKSEIFDNKTETFEALKSGKVDAVAMGSLGGIKGFKVLGFFGSDPFYFMTGKNNSVLMSEMDNALGQIFAFDPTFADKLYDKYYSNKSASTTLLFTREEEEYIKKSGVVTVGLMPDRSPLSSVDSDNKPQGITVNLMNIISQKSGLKFSYNFLDVGEKAVDYLNNSEGDIVAGIATSAFSNINETLLQSESLHKSSIVFVGRSGTRFSTSSDLTVALPADFINGKESVSELYPNFKFYYCRSTEDCLKAVRDGKADVMLQNLYIIRECLQSPLYNELDVFPAYTFDEQSRVVSLNDNAILISIINKTIAGISEQEANDVLNNNTISKGYHYGLYELFYKYRIAIIQIGVLVLMLFVMIIIVAVIRQRNYLAEEKINGDLEKINARLAVALSQADRANVAKSQFLSRMSHEIRTPMNAIVGLTQIAKQNETDPQKIEDCLIKIDTSSKVLLNIINDVLDMSAIESDKLKIDHTEFDMKDIILGIKTIYYSQCKAKGVKLIFTADIEHETVIGDSLRINQILLNLVSNAYKFTGSGGNIEVSVKEISSDNKTVVMRFTVSDSGCGMTPHMLKHIFEPFEQENASTAKEYGGSGLGMSIVKHLTELMNGEVSVTSEKGKGTAFTVDIPFEASPERNCNCDLSKINDIRVLVINDGSEQVSNVSDVLRKIGIKYDIAETLSVAAEMIEKANSEKSSYNACFIEKEENDSKITEKIRKAGNRNIKIVSVTESETDKEAVNEITADYCVTMPLFKSTIYKLILALSKGEAHNDYKKSQKFDFTGHKVLLIDDQSLNAEIATELLKLVNMDCKYAENGLAAVKMFSESAPGEYDAILMDVQMPEMNGYDAARTIRKLTHPDSKTIPIYAMTANAFKDDIAKALSAGMNGHIAKPVDTQKLYELLYRAVSDKNI